MITTEQKIQEEQYNFPYHHLVNMVQFDNHKTLYGGISYFGYMSRVISKLDGFDWKNLLDVGCGDAKMISELSKKFRQRSFVGIDYSERAILFARAFNYTNSNTRFVVGDLKDEKDKFDCVTLIETLEHIPDAQIVEVVDAIWDRLNNGGHLVVSVPSTNDPLNTKHYRHYDLPLIEKTFHNFKLVSTEYYISNSPIYNFLTKISGKMGNFKIIRLLILKIVSRFYFKTSPKKGTHIISVFQKG